MKKKAKDVPDAINSILGIGIVPPVKDKVKYRIKNSNGTYLNAGTGEDSWFTLQKARELVNREKGQIIIESDGTYDLWEVF